MTSSFITEIPLKTSSKEQAVLKKRFWAAKQQYNALLGEALRRLRAMRSDARWEEVKNHYERSEKKQGSTLFKELAQAYGYREYDLYGYTKQWNKRKNNTFLSIGARMSQKLAKRAFEAVEIYRKGLRGKPRFKGLRGIHSMEDTSIDGNFRLKGDQLHYLGLTLPLCYNDQDPVHRHGVQAEKKYVRLVQRNYNGRLRYVAQIVCAGTPLIKNPHKKGTVGLDIGPSTIAIVAPQKEYASLGIFADQCKPHYQAKRRLQQKLARQLRAANPQAYSNSNIDTWHKKDKHWHRKRGTSIKGKPLNNRPKALRKTVSKLADYSRREAAHRKAQHGQMANQILQLGTTIKAEKLNYKSFQRNWGKSIGLRAPSIFLNTLQRKAANAGGGVEAINTYKTALSQTCHCGRKEKKSLKERWHRCPCGVTAQRDLYSAFLACFVVKNKLMVNQAQQAWKRMDIVLHTAMSNIEQPSSGPLPATLGFSGSEAVVCTIP